METTLHRQLKALYAPDDAGQEVALDGFRIDAVAEDGRLIEIQHASLGAIRDKVRVLLEDHDVHVVKPLAARKYLIKKTAGGRLLSSRYSPSRASMLHLFEDLVHFVSVFPHPRLTLEAVLTEQEEHRVPRRKRRRMGKDYRVIDRQLREIVGRMELRTSSDLAGLLPKGLQKTFTTRDIADRADVPRWLAQKMAFCLRKTGAVNMVGKQSNALVYEYHIQETQGDFAGACRRPQMADPPGRPE